MRDEWPHFGNTRTRATTYVKRNLIFWGWTCPLKWLWYGKFIGVWWTKTFSEKKKQNKGGEYFFRLRKGRRRGKLFMTNFSQNFEKHSGWAKINTCKIIQISGCTKLNLSYQFLSLPSQSTRKFIHTNKGSYLCKKLCTVFVHIVFVYQGWSLLVY